MTEVNAPLAESFDDADRAALSQGLVRRAIMSVVRDIKAQLGLLWILVILIAAVFAPFICNSHPILMKKQGQWSSPLLHFLTGTDVILQVIFWSGLILYLLPHRVCKIKTWIWLAIVALSCSIFPCVINPPRIEVYEAFREQQAAGKIESIYYTPIHFSPSDHLRDDDDEQLKAPTAAHWMGTTFDSADLASNMIYACRIALSIGFISTGIAVVIGILIGGLMGYYSGWIDLFGMRLVEIFDAIPALLLLLCFVAFFTPNLYVMMAIIGFTSWVGYAYFVRAEFLSLRDRDFVQAARAAGLSTYSILFRHMLPNGLTPIIVSASFGVASAILAEATLSFLGIGLVGEASWGTLLNQALGEGGSFYWWTALYPGLAIFLTVLAYNLIGESLRDALDPRLNMRV